jgi:O-acetyl-ADP-ribose deacetylase (regulator of RNase III)
MSIQYLNGDITFDDADILVNTVNTVGVMGKGVALSFKTRWPEIMPEYQALCDDGRLIPGGCALLPLPGAQSRWWAALATKHHWRYPSRYRWVENGLNKLAELANEVGATSIAIPPPGCGNGGLVWHTVRPMVVSALSSFDLRIYGSPE